MKRILSFILGLFMAGMVAGTATVATFPENAYAAGCDGKGLFLGLRAWYAGLSEADPSGKCAMKKPGSDGKEMSEYVWTIVLNVLFDISLLVGYAAIIFVVFGGFKYIMSNGEPGKVAQAKTIITNALIGFVIGILGTIIVNTILIVVGSAAS